ncbi:MAG: amidohydrolase family protein [Clostridiales bacterium]|nr:amidohydrolase family protein [Clostridiales bacterium]
MLFINAKVMTMSAAGVFDPGYVRVEGDKITACGPMEELALAAEEESTDLRGALCLPGFIDAHTHLGMWEDGLDFEGDDGNEDTDPVTPQLRAIDAVNPTDRCFREALEAGITTVLTGPGSANPIAGQFAALKTCGRRVDDMILMAPAAMKFALGENPKSTYHGKSQAPVTRMAIASLIREQLEKARRYGEEQEKAKDDPELDPPEYDAKCEALLPALRREIKCHFHAHRADDIFTAVRIAKEFGLDYVIVHGTEGYQMADLLAAEGCGVLSGPLLCDRSKPELKALTPAGAGLLHKAGTPVAIVTDHPVIPIQYLPLCAGLAVRNGMERDAALAAITIRAAQICGIDGRVGSIEPGKDADLAVFWEDPLSLSAEPVLVVCAGETALDRR